MNVSPVVLDVHVIKKDKKLKALQQYVRNPFHDKDLEAIRQRLREEIAGVATNPDSIPRTGPSGASHPYHTYPSDHEGEMSSEVFAEHVDAGTIIFGSTSEHSNILEDGKKASDKVQCFRGYYPNKKILMAILRITRPFKVPKSLRYREQRRSRIIAGRVEHEEIAEAVQEAYGAQRMLGLKGRKISKERVKTIYGRGRIHGVSTKFAVNPDEFAFRLGIIPSALPDISFYRYGIFTVIARTRRMKQYKVFSRTGEWLLKYMEKEMAAEVTKINKNIG